MVIIQHSAIISKLLDSMFLAGVGKNLLTAPFFLTWSVMWQSNFAGKVVEFSNIKVLQ